MTINFNFKKYFKYFIIGILCYILLHSFTNVKAFSNLDSQYIVNFTNEENTDLSSFLIKGNTSNLDAYLSKNFNITNFNNYYDDIKTYIYSKLGYSSWQSFIDDNYFISLFKVHSSPFISSNLSKLSLYFYYLPKNNSNVDLFNLSLGASIRSNSTPTINANQTYYFQIGAVYWTGFYGFSSSNNDFSNKLLTFNSSNSFTNNGISSSCSKVNDFGCLVTGYDTSSHVLSLLLTNSNKYDKGQFLFFTDTNKSNLSISAGGVSQLGSTDYRFTKYMLSNNDTIYNVGDILSKIDFDYFSIDNTIVKEFNDNSYGIDFGTIDNNVVSDDTINFTDSSVLCPLQDSDFSGNSKDFVNNICYITNDDFVSYNTNFTNFYNYVNFMFPNSNNVVSIDTHNYYIFTIRTYSNYPLKVNSLFFKLFNYSALLPANIISVNFHDYSFYYDYQIVFNFDSAFSDLNVNGYIENIFVSFDSMNNYVNVLPDVYSFGISKVTKLHSYIVAPDSSVINNDYLNNSLSNISNSLNGSFFTNFKVNDFGLSSIILLPINYIRQLRDFTCSPISLPIPHLDNFTLPCVSSFMSTNFNSIWVIFKLVVNGLLIYRACIDLYGIVKNIYKPDNDRIEVVDL